MGDSCFSVKANVRIDNDDGSATGEVTFPDLCVTSSCVTVIPENNVVVVTKRLPPEIKDIVINDVYSSLRLPIVSIPV